MTTHPTTEDETKQNRLRTAAAAVCPQDATCPALTPGDCWSCEQTALAVIDAYQDESENSNLRAALEPMIDQARNHVADDPAWTGRETVWVPITISDLRAALRLAGGNDAGSQTTQVAKRHNSA